MLGRFPDLSSAEEQRLRSALQTAEDEKTEATAKHAMPGLKIEHEIKVFMATNSN